MKKEMKKAQPERRRRNFMSLRLLAGGAGALLPPADADALSLSRGSEMNSVVVVVVVVEGTNWENGKRKEIKKRKGRKHSSKKREGHTAREGEEERKKRRSLRKGDQKGKCIRREGEKK